MFSIFTTFTPMIHKAYNKSVFAQYYYQALTGETVEKEIAQKRLWSHITSGKIDDKALLKACKQILNEQKQLLK